MNTSVHFSSKSVEWETPQEIFDELNKEFDFQLDVCATDVNTKCKTWYTEKQDGLLKSWNAKRCWMNPPYGRMIKSWIVTAYEESLKGALVVCLLPSRTDTSWWHDYVMKASEIRYIRGRLKFSGSKNSAPFPSAIVIFRPGGNLAMI